MSNPSIEYCPVCKHEITAANLAEVHNGLHPEYIFIHDEISHTEEEMKALSPAVHLITA